MSDQNLDVEIEYVYEAPIEDDLFKQFSHVFEKFSNPEASAKEKKLLPEAESHGKELVKVEEPDDKDKLKQLIEAKAEPEEKKVSKRQLKQMTRMTVAELKQKVDRPELVELHDVTAKDPIFLLNLKSIKNSIPVPRHWSSKRRYLQGKRGYEKPPYQLPDFIRQTGIMEMRDSVQEKDKEKSLKAQTRERVKPKLGKLQLDYQLLHDAFFKYQTKPPMTIHGDLYYEGKEFEKKFKKRPGELSNELRKALGMPTGRNANRYPLPWLSAMKTHGPPPSYPYLQIPGLNCPFLENDNENNDDDDDGGARSDED